MRPLEIVIILSLAIHLLWSQTHPWVVRLLPACALLVTLIHFAIEGYRWQMVPIYVLTPSLAIVALIGMRQFWDTKTAAPIQNLRLALGGVFVLLAVSTALPILLPVPSIRKPSGPYQVGTTIFELTDVSRKEIYSGKDEPRRFQIQVWYPAEPRETDKHAPWVEHADIFGQAISDFLGLPVFFLDHLTLVKTPAYLDVPVAKSNGAYPVIVFSHGWKGFAAQNSGQAIELASHGYVVVGVQHTYGAIVTVFNDGTVAPNNPNALPAGAPDDKYDAAARKLVDQWAGDISFALSSMTQQNNDSTSPFYFTLDVSRVGAYGHSTGGGAAIQFCGIDPRCKALLGLDPFMTPVSLDVLDNGLTQPAFFMFSQVWADDTNSKNNRLFYDFLLQVPSNRGVISIDGTKHYDFSDLPMLSPVSPQLGLKGPIDGQRMLKIANTYLLEFFDMTLKGESVNLFDGNSTEFLEVKILE